jgi:hypothetical protein
VFQKCASCHRPGEAGPFPLLSYQDVKKRGQLIAEVTQRRYMPPWHAAAGYGATARSGSGASDCGRVDGPAREMAGQRITSRYVFFPSGEGLFLLPFTTQRGAYADGGISLKNGVLAITRSGGRVNEFRRCQVF